MVKERASRFGLSVLIAVPGQLCGAAAGVGAGEQVVNRYECLGQCI